VADRGTKRFEPVLFSLGVELDMLQSGNILQSCGSRPEFFGKTGSGIIISDPNPAFFI
jgi:hypothetical protein